MMSKYSVAFLIPRDTVLHLGNDGWEFNSTSRVPAEVEALLKSELSSTEFSLCFSSYEAGHLKVSVFKDTDGKIESVYFRFYEGFEPTLPPFLTEIVQLNDLDFFIPSQ